MDVLGIRLNKIEANKDNDSMITGVDVNIKIDTIEPQGANLTLNFTYTADYRPKVGGMKILGSVFLKDTPQAAKKLSDEWKKSKTMPREISENILNMINASAGLNGIFVAKAINLAPPLVPPKIQIMVAPQK